MKHYGDIKLLSGYTLPVVDVITGGSPCQDLSVAGKRAGLDGERSGLFMEQIRIVKEMREHDSLSGRPIQLIRPRYCVWENVPGAFSSNGGKDFQAVLTEFIKVSVPNAPDVPMPERGGWSKSGFLYDAMGRWSVAWRTHDAQYHGVPQRRKRICVLADFNWLSAGEILFDPQYERTAANGEPLSTVGYSGNVPEREIQAVSKSMSGYLESCGAEREETAGAVGGGAEGAIFYDAYQHHGWRRSETSGTLTVGQNNTVRGDTPLVAAYGISSYDSNAMKSSNPHSGIYEAYTARTLDTAHALHAKANCQYREDSETYIVAAIDCRNGTANPDINGTLQAKEQGFNLNSNNVVLIWPEVRRLMPIECERLQGFPDGWTDIGDWVDSKGKTHKAADSPRYKALGNSIALPFWQYLARRICAQYERDITMGSLFDGIGGFPLVFERCGAKAVWASEIEEFPIAVTKKHFPEV